MSEYVDLFKETLNKGLPVQALICLSYWFLMNIMCKNMIVFYFQYPNMVGTCVFSTKEYLNVTLSFSPWHIHHPSFSVIVTKVGNNIVFEQC